MTHSIIEERLKRYQSKTEKDEENALKEILQEIALYALATTDFFTKALFQGGTALRILYQLPRFSEDLDFILKKPDKNFQWQPYMDKIADSFKFYDITPEIIDRSKVESPVKKLFLKDNSIGKMLQLHFHHHAHKKLEIRLEIDTNPPEGSGEEIKFLDFPMDYPISAQNLPSNFAGKCHALLCRPYAKGRDWFDLNWYIARRIPVNLNFLQAAINQLGQWQDQNTEVTNEWLYHQLEQKILTLDWDKIKKDVGRFITEPREKESLNLWSEAFFIEKIKEMRRAAFVSLMIKINSKFAQEQDEFLKNWTKMCLADALQAFQTGWLDLCNAHLEKALLKNGEISRDPKYSEWYITAKKIDEKILEQQLQELRPKWVYQSYAP